MAEYAALNISNHDWDNLDIILSSASSEKNDFEKVSVHWKTQNRNIKQKSNL